MDRRVASRMYVNRTWIGIECPYVLLALYTQYIRSGRRPEKQDVREHLLRNGNSYSLSEFVKKFGNIADTQTYVYLSIFGTISPQRSVRTSCTAVRRAYSKF